MCMISNIDCTLPTHVPGEIFDEAAQPIDLVHVDLVEVVGGQLEVVGEVLLTPRYL